MTMRVRPSGLEVEKGMGEGVTVSPYSVPLVRRWQDSFRTPMDVDDRSG